MMSYLSPRERTKSFIAGLIIGLVVVVPWIMIAVSLL